MMYYTARRRSPLPALRSWIWQKLIARRETAKNSTSGAAPKPSLLHSNDVLYMGQEHRGCLRCVARGWDCDSRRPQCTTCTEAPSPPCSYEWTVDNILALFPPQFNMNDTLSICAAEVDTDYGDFGMVYRTQSKSDGSLVAVKVLSCRKQAPQETFLLALREAFTWSQLSHDHLVPLIGVANYRRVLEEPASPQLCFVSPWMVSGNVMDYLDTDPNADRKTFMIDIADTVRYLHARSPPVIHGDIRSRNVLVNLREGQPRACLTDFVLSIFLEERSRPPSSGHIRWLAPERLFRESPVLPLHMSKSKSSDVFEMCRTFYDILSGHCPFAGYDESSVQKMVFEGRHPERPPNPKVEKLTSALWSTLERGWSNNPEERPPAAEIHAGLSDDTTSTAVPPIVSRPLLLPAERLYTASFTGDDTAVRLLIRMRADVDAILPGGGYVTALQAASGRGHESVVRFLLDSGANVSVQAGHLGTALHTASEAGRKAVVELLLDRGADVNAQSGHYSTALQAASACGREAVARLLLDRGAKVNAYGGCYGTALLAASVRGHEKTVQLLLETGADLEMRVQTYGTALQGASVRGHERVVRLLLVNGADLNAREGGCGTALRAAWDGGHRAVARMLILAGAVPIRENYFEDDGYYEVLAFSRDVLSIMSSFSPVVESKSSQKPVPSS